MKVKLMMLQKAVRRKLRKKIKRKTNKKSGLNLFFLLKTKSSFPQNHKKNIFKLKRNVASKCNSYFNIKETV